MKFYIPLTVLFAALAIAAPAETETDDSVSTDAEAAPEYCRDVTRYNKCLRVENSPITLCPELY
ncbi:hypothetical protein BDV24DRAFT_73161 [Aspergillus arachidicola]|uniref:Uncharacterized protein n=1 Tax=Aspergillus arachidicola TaxID=656916 RepID=A0A5N6Y498_9EURO|nr:hypothetical protein BDV24DRAFT_73161 [Aspergillus arachidicola]